MSKSSEIALWAGLSAFFGNLVGLKLLELLSHNDLIQIAGAVFVSLIVAGAVYSKERLQAAKARRNGE